MKGKLAWQRIPRSVLAQHLREVEIVESEAVGETSIYHCRGKGGESMAVSLPGEVALIITLKPPPSPPLERRRKRRAGEETTPT